MKIKLTLKQLLKLRDSITNELKSNQKAIIKLNSCKIQNKEFFRETLLKIEFAQEELRRDIVNIKANITMSNIGCGRSVLPDIIFMLSELKEKLKCYQSLNMKKGKVKEHGKIITYSTILSEETANKKINIIKKEINDIEHELEVHNKSTILDIDVTKITFDIASKIID